MGSSGMTSVHKGKLSRRGFLKAVTVASAVSVYGCSKDSGGDTIFTSGTQTDVNFDQAAKKADVLSSSFCSVNCTSRCRLIGRVKDGVLVGVTPGELPNRPGYGSACLRGMSLPWKLQSNAHRLMYPMYRSDRSKFGTMDGFQRITWKRAYELLAEKIKAASTPEKVRFFQMTGNLAVMMYDAPNRFADTIGASLFQWGNEAIMSDHGGSRAMSMCYGVTRGSHDHRDYMNSKMLLLWGRNVADTHTSELQYIIDAKKNGTKVITIDPRYSSTGFVADEWIPIRPGTDSYMALAMMNYVFANNLQDDVWLKYNTCAPMLIDMATGKYVRDNLQNFYYWDNTADALATIAGTTGATYTGEPDISDAERTITTGDGVTYTCKTSMSYLKAEAARHTPADAAVVTGIPQAKIIEIADFYARNKPCGIRMGQGMQRYNYSYQGFRAVAVLGAVCGQINISGGGVAHMGGSLPIYNHGSSWQNRATWNTNRPNSARKEMRGIDLYNSVDGGEDGTFTKDIPDVLWITYSNLVNQSPDYNRLTKKVLPNIPFVVYQDPFITCTSAFSDLLLPAKSYWENWDFVERAPWVLLHKPAISPIGDALSDIEIFSGVAKELGYEQYWNKTDKEWVMDRFSNTAHGALNGFVWDEFEKTGIWTIPNADYSPVFTNYTYSGTYTKKFEFYTEAISDNSLSAEDRRQVVPCFGKPYEDPNDKSAGALASKYPLVFIQYHDRQSVHTQHLLIPMLKVVAKEPFVEINTQDAVARGINHGDTVRVFNERGSCKVKAFITPGLIKGTVAIPAGWAPEHFIEGNFQMLTHCKQNAVENLLYESNFAAYDNLVQVEKA